MYSQSFDLHIINSVFKFSNLSQVFVFIQITFINYLITRNLETLVLKFYVVKICTK